MDSKQRVHIVTLANSIIGVSILAMPYCFKQCGILLSILLLLFSSALCRIACHFLLKSAIKARLRTFEFLAYHVFGSVGKLFVEIGMIGFLLGTCVAFFVVMGDLGPQIVAQIMETKSVSTLRTTILIAIGLFCVLPLGLLRNINSLSSVCIATILFYGVLVLQIFSESAPHLMANDWLQNVDLWRPAGILQCIPIFSVALFCQTQLFEIYQAIPNASLDKMNDLVRIAVNICTSVYIFVGIFGYIAISHKSNFSGNILMDLQPSMLTDTMKIGFVLSVACSFPLVIFPCRASLFSLLFKRTYAGLHDSSVQYIPESKFRVLTLMIVMMSLVIGVLIPNIEFVLGIVGSTIGIMICVIFPATCFICLTNKNTSERILAQLMLMIGIMIMVLGTYANLYPIENVPVIHKDKLLARAKSLDVHIKMLDVKESTEKKSVQINLPDAISEIKDGKQIKEVRHEPPQPEEPPESPPKQYNVELKPIVPNIDVVEKLEKVKEQIQSNDVREIETNVNKSAQNVDVAQEAKVIEMDLEAIKKEDLELAKDSNANANLVNLVEEKRKILNEIIKQKKELEQEKKIKAVENIENIAKIAIESIVKDRKIKIINEEKEKSVEKVESKTSIDIPQIAIQNVKIPLAYQLGLQNKTIDIAVKDELKVIDDNKADTVTTDRQSSIKINSAIDEISKQVAGNEVIVTSKSNDVQIETNTKNTKAMLNRKEIHNKPVENVSVENKEGPNPNGRDILSIGMLQ